MEKYEIYNGNTKVGVLYHDENGKNKMEFVDGLTLHNIPIMFYYMYRDKRQRVFEGAEVEEWIKSRGVDRGRPNLYEILMGVGIKENDTWDIFKMFNGESLRDRYWANLIKERVKKYGW